MISRAYRVNCKQDGRKLRRDEVAYDGNGARRLVYVLRAHQIGVCEGLFRVHILD